MSNPGSAERLLGERPANAKRPLAEGPERTKEPAVAPTPGAPPRNFAAATHTPSRRSALPGVALPGRALSGEPLAPPLPHRGWYSRGYLPHRDHPGLLQSITYRLADSAPTEVLNRLRRNVEGIPEHRRGPEFRKQLEEWLDAGHGSCVLRRPEVASLVIEGWKQYACQRYDLIAWVVMPNHVHVLIRAYTGVPLGKIVQAWKSYSAREIRRLLGRQPLEAPSAPSAKGSGKQTLGAPSACSANNPDIPSKPNTVWQRDYWDRYIRDEKHFAAVIEYIHQNPVKAGLARRAEDWAGSSAREYAEGSFAELGFGLPVEGGGAGLEGVEVEEDAEQALGAPRLGAPRVGAPRGRGRGL